MSRSFGGGSYSYGPYGGRAIPSFAQGIGATIELYDNTLARKSTFQTGSGDFLGVVFTLDESGPRDFVLLFAESQNIAKKDIVKIKLFGSADYFFTGVVRVTPIPGSTKAEYSYSGFGLNDYLLRVNTESQSYASKTISYILEDLLDNIIVPKTPITKNPSKIIAPDITITTFDVNYSQIPEVLDSLRSIANSEGQYISGVDQEGDFFFKPKNTEIKAVLVVGARGRFGINDYQPEDQAEIKTKYFLLDKDGNYITTVSSTLDNDVFESKLVAPDIDNATAQKWAEGILAENETVTRRASVEWKIENPDPLVLLADGNIRIISEIPPKNIAPAVSFPFGSGTFGSGFFGGEQPTGIVLDDTLQSKEVSYIMTGGQAVRKIQLGNLPVRMDEQIIAVNKKLTDLQISLGR